MFNSRWIAAILAGLALCATAWVHAAAGSRGGHLARADCGGCHLAGNDVDPARASKLVGSQEMLCTRCHERAVKIGHPTGFMPKGPLPAEYPLDWKGELTCTTCHVPHGTEPGLLRGSKRARAMCLACHDRAFFSRMKDAGTSLVISGHLDIGSGRGTLDIDAHSLHCLGCHASSHAGGGTVSIGRSGVLRHASGAAPHPIGTYYRDALKKGDYHPEFALAQKNIMLSEGRISCLSCHEAYKREHGKLVVPMTRSALCLSCHAK